MESIEHNIKRILIPFDFSRDNVSVVNLAVQIAQQNSATLYLLHVVDSNLLGSGSAFSGKFFFHGATILDRAQKKLAELKNQIESQTAVPVVIESQVGSLSSVVLDYVPKWEIDLVLMSVRVQKLTNFFTTSKAYSVVVNSQVPVITVPESCKITQLKSVLYPVREVDGVISKLNSLIPVLKNYATVHLLGMHSAERKSESKAVPNALKFLKLRLRRKNMDVGRVEAVITDSPAKEILAQVSRFSPDLLAINVTTDRTLKKMFKRNFTEKIIFKSGVPVLFYNKDEPENGVHAYVQVPYPMYPV